LAHGVLCETARLLRRRRCRCIVLLLDIGEGGRRDTGLLLDACEGDRRAGLSRRWTRRMSSAPSSSGGGGYWAPL
jgi:hypothetical protein